jgi:hypothetical protein
MATEKHLWPLRRFIHTHRLATNLTRLSLCVHSFAAELRVQHVRGSLFLPTGIPVETPTLILEMIGYEERNV